MAPATPRSARRKLARAAGVTLPPDLLYEVLLRLPAGSVCRFRTVCRSWHALLSCGRFLAAHAARRGPLLLAGAPYRDDPRSWHVDLVDLDGDVARRTRLEAESVRELLTCGDLACVVGAGDRVGARVLDSATGAVTPLPYGLSEENKSWDGKLDAFTTYAFGRVSSTGEYKVLRLVHIRSDYRNKQLVEVLTHDGRGGAHGRARWRGTQGPPFHVAGASMDGTGVMNGMAVVDGVVYFLAGQIAPFPLTVDEVICAKPGTIASFDLETEAWMPILHGPLNRHQGNPELMLQHDPLRPPLLTITELKGFLVTVHLDRRQQLSIMDLWVLIDSNEETWVKKYNIQVELCWRRLEFHAHPSFMLDDTRIVQCVRPKGGFRVYDLQTGTCRDLDVSKYVTVNLYKRCLC